jgi:protein-S-isoprenylcysteine O-methyltransferase Ste14
MQPAAPVRSPRWFVVRASGQGWRAATWQGKLILAVLLAAALGLMLAGHWHHPPDLFALAGVGLLLVGGQILAALARRKGRAG